MKKLIRSAGTAAVILAAGVVGASAQQLWYLDMGAGAAFKPDVTIKEVARTKPVPTSKFRFDPGYRVDIAVGYQVHPVVSVEFQSGLVHNSVDSVVIGGARSSLSSLPGAPTGFSFDLYQVPLMANAVFRRDFGSPLTPFIGVGAGGILNVGKFKGGGLKDNESDLTFGYQGTAGFSYAVTPDADLSLVYRFLSGTDLNFGGQLKTRAPITHSVGLALTYRF